MNIQTDILPVTSSATIATVPRRRWRATFVALGMAALLGVGAGVGAASLVDDGSGSVAHPQTAAATATVAVSSGPWREVGAGTAAAGMALGRESHGAAVASASYFTRLGKRIASSF